ncbi:MAG: hypothetical protein ACUZ8O_11330 [Candidatus Anammoxibacter sp.]
MMERKSRSWNTGKLWLGLLLTVISFGLNSAFPVKNVYAGFSCPDVVDVFPPEFNILDGIFETRVGRTGFYIITFSGEANSVVTNSDPEIVEVKPLQIDNVNRHIYTLNALESGTTDITWDFTSDDPDCFDCSGSCFLTVNVIKPGHECPIISGFELGEFSNPSELYVIEGDDLAKSEVILNTNPKIVSISPTSISSATDQVYTITRGSAFDSDDQPSIASSDITIEWSALDPDCSGNCSGSCKFSVLVLGISDEGLDEDMDDDNGGDGLPPRPNFSEVVKILLDIADKSKDGLLSLGVAALFLTDNLDAAFDRLAPVNIDAQEDTIDENIDKIEESVIPELTPIVVIASVDNDLRLDLEEENGSLALKNSTTDNSKEIESLELAITNFEQAIASLEKMEVGMLNRNAIPLLEDAIKSLETGNDLIQSVIDALEEDDDIDDGTMGCAGSSSLGIPQTKTMKKLMNKLRDRVESNWTVDHDYIELFNENSKELTQIVNNHPALASRLLSERTRFMPSILLLIFGEPVELSTTDVKRIDAILDAISKYASPQLKDAIDQIRSDIQSEEVLSSFGISVE